LPAGRQDQVTKKQGRRTAADPVTPIDRRIGQYLKNFRTLAHRRAGLFSFNRAAAARPRGKGQPEGG
jgi:hypothetical protein